MAAIILCYHKVGPESEEGRRLNIEPARIKSHVRFFARRSKIVLAREFSPLARSLLPASCIAFTFDDAYQSTLSHIPEIFGHFGAKATIYAVSGRTTIEWDGPDARPLASVHALLSAQKEGHEIGNHTATHPRLAELSLEDQEREISEAHHSFLAAGLQMDSFCYPFGSFSPETPAILSKLGYSVGVSLKKGTVKPADSSLLLPRIAVAFSDALPMLLYKTMLRPRLPRRV